MFVFTVYVMFAIFNCCGQKLLYADFANKIYHIIYHYKFSIHQNLISPFRLQLLSDYTLCKAEDKIFLRLLTLQDPCLLLVLHLGDFSCRQKRDHG